MGTKAENCELMVGFTIESGDFGDQVVIKAASTRTKDNASATMAAFLKANSKLTTTQIEKNEKSSSTFWVEPRNGVNQHPVLNR